MEVEAVMIRWDVFRVSRNRILILFYLRPTLLVTFNKLYFSLNNHCHYTIRPIFPIIILRLRANMSQWRSDFVARCNISYFYNFLEILCYPPHNQARTVIPMIYIYYTNDLRQITNQVELLFIIFLYLQLIKIIFK